MPSLSSSLTAGALTPANAVSTNISPLKENKQSKQINKRREEVDFVISPAMPDVTAVRNEISPQQQAHL